MSIISHQEYDCDWYKVAQLIQCGRHCKDLTDNQADSLCIHRAFFDFTALYIVITAVANTGWQA